MFVARRRGREKSAFQKRAEARKLRDEVEKTKAEKPVKSPTQQASEQLEKRKQAEKPQPVEVKAEVKAESVEKSSKKAGRPRSKETIDRDNKIFELLKSRNVGMRKNEIQEAMELDPQKVYQSLKRLSEEGRVSRSQANSRMWVAVH